jgi:hypothetical protein
VAFALLAVSARNGAGKEVYVVMSRPVLLAASLAAALILLGTSTAGAVDYSGTVVGIDRGAGTIVIGEIGP